MNFVRPPFVLFAALSAALTLGASASAETYLSDQDAHAIVLTYLSTHLPATYRGVDSKGQACFVTLSEEAEGLRFVVSSGEASLDFVVEHGTSSSLCGWVNGDEMRASRFVDREGSLLHGQFGVENELSVKKTAAGALSSVSVSRIKVEDLSSESLGAVECGALH